MNVPTSKISYNQPQSLGDDYQSSRPIYNQQALTNSIVNNNSDDEKMSVSLKIFTCIICCYYCCPCYLSYLLYSILYGDDTKKSKTKENLNNYPNNPSVLNVNNTIIKKSSKNQRHTISNITPISFDSNNILRGFPFQGLSQNEEKKLKAINEDINVNKKTDKRFTVNSSILTVNSKRKSATISELISKRLEKEKNKKEIKEREEDKDDDEDEKEKDIQENGKTTKLNVNDKDNKDKKNNTDISEVSD